MLRGRARRGRGSYVAADDDPLDAAQERGVRAVLALGGVPQADLADGVQQVRLRLLERAASGREAPRDVSAWAAVVASNLAMDWHRAKRRQERLGERLAALRPAETPSGEETACCPWPSPGVWTSCPTRSARSWCCGSTPTCRCVP